MRLNFRIFYTRFIIFWLGKNFTFLASLTRRLYQLNLNFPLLSYSVRLFCLTQLGTSSKSMAFHFWVGIKVECCQVNKNIWGSWIGEKICQFQNLLHPSLMLADNPVCALPLPLKILHFLRPHTTRNLIFQKIWIFRISSNALKRKQEAT